GGLELRRDGQEYEEGRHPDEQLVHALQELQNWRVLNCAERRRLPGGGWSDNSGTEGAQGKRQPREDLQLHPSNLEEQGMDRMVGGGHAHPMPLGARGWGQDNQGLRVK